LRKLKAKEQESADIPEEYKRIPDPDAYRTSLDETVKQKRKTHEQALKERSASKTRLEDAIEEAPDAAETLDQAARELSEAKALLKHWLHIQRVFQAQKEGIKTNPTQDIADRFTEYLQLISDGRVSSELPNTGKLDMKIYSGNHTMDFDLLSEGTKETVSLAFRLAVLDHLFPEGGGVLVLDDPLNDMDPDRVAQSCRLIQECAKRHQVIFLTCRDEYLGLLGGNVIRLDANH
jgi:uncharacterized protein YhaN